MHKIRLLLYSLGRDMLAMRNRILAIFLISGCGLAMFTGVYSAIDSLFDTRTDYYKQYNMADLELRFIAEDQINMPDFDSFKGIKSYENRLISPAQIQLENKAQLSATLVALDFLYPRKSNLLRIIKGHALDPKKPNEIVIEHNLAKYHHYKIGDHLRLRIGKDHYDLTIRGIAISPEYLVAVANPNFLFPSKGSMAVIFSSLNLIKERLGFKLVNSLIFDLPNENKNRLFMQKIADYADHKLALEQIIPLEEQPGYLFLDLDLNAFAIFVPAVILIFTLTSIIITLFLMFQWISAKRQQFGLFMALGYGKPRLLLSSVFPGIVLFGGTVFMGFLLSYVTLYGFGVTYANAISFPEPILTLDSSLLVLGSIGVIIALSVSIFLPQLKLLSLTPQDAVRSERSQKRPEMGIITRKIAGLLRGRIWMVYAMRNLLRSKMVTVMTILSVTLALSVSLSYFISMTSFESGIMKSFISDEWDLAVDFISPTWEDEIFALPGLSEVKTSDIFIRGVIQLVHNGQRKNSIVAGIDSTKTLRRPVLVQGRMLREDDVDAIILQHKLTEELGYRINDPITISSRGKTFQANLVGTIASPIPGEAIAPLSTVQKWLDMEEQFTGMFLRANHDKLKSVVLNLQKSTRIARITEKSNLHRELTGIVQEALIIIYVAAAFSIAVAVLFVFTSTSFSILQRRSEYAMLRVLGFSDRIVKLTILTETFLIGLLGAILSIPLGYLISVYLNTFLSEAWFSIETVIQTRDIVTILLPACIIIPIASWPSIKVTLDTPMWKTLRERMFG